MGVGFFWGAGGPRCSGFRLWCWRTVCRYRDNTKLHTLKMSVSWYVDYTSIKTGHVLPKDEIQKTIKHQH